ncbi:MAG: hypothetical protein ACYCV4_02010 [Dermatophilaceae bacterium]
MKGQHVCRSHGGATANNRAYGKRVVALQEAAVMMQTLGEPVDGDPGDIILGLIARTNGHVRWLWDRVREVDPTALVWSRTKAATGGQNKGLTFEAKPNVWYEMYTDASDRLYRYCEAAVKIGLREREVRMAESLGSEISRVMDAILLEMGHDPMDPEVARVVAQHLRITA